MMTQLQCIGRIIIEQVVKWKIEINRAVLLDKETNKYFKNFVSSALTLEIRFDMWIVEYWRDFRVNIVHKPERGEDSFSLRF